jgi:membrane-bound lytic murein transglycosylase A
MGLELLWVDSAIDAFFLHIQGSGRVILDTGELVRVGFAGRNGQPYFAIGRDLVKRGIVSKENISLQFIRSWLKKNPNQAVNLMQKNKSYVFFREVKSLKGKALNNTGPIGASGVYLTPGRSLAVDRRYFSMGIPMWVDTTHPLTKRPLRRLMVAQDTGGAILGPIRGDFFWGAGRQAREAAGRMKQLGQLYILLPRPRS